MCFSPVASFGSAAVVGGIAVAALAHVRRKNEVVLGLVPLLFSVHQFMEGMVWLWLEGRLSPAVGYGFAVAYIAVANVIVPAIIPWSIFLAEPTAGRRRWLQPLVVLGTGVAGVAAWELTEVPVIASIHHHSVQYEYTLNQLWWFGVLYIIATCVPSFLSSYPWMVTFGVLIVVTLSASAFFKLQYLTSVWCALAAVVSVLIYLHFLRVRRMENLSSQA